MPTHPDAESPNRRAVLAAGAAGLAALAAPAPAAEAKKKRRPKPRAFAAVTITAVAIGQGEFDGFFEWSVDVHAIWPSGQTGILSGATAVAVGATTERVRADIAAYARTLVSLLGPGGVAPDEVAVAMP